MKDFSAFARRWHRRLSVVIGVQLLLWTVSGLVFALLPIEEVRGENLLAEGAPQLRLESSDSAVAPDLINPAGPPSIGDPESLAEMTREQAMAAAKIALLHPAELRTAELISTAPNEYRGGPLPAWKIDFADATTLYLDPVTAKVNAVRCTKWRIFDFLWMLHIMDYDERDDFNSPLLIIAAAFGVLTSLSGLVLTFVIYRRRWKRRKSRISSC